MTASCFVVAPIGEAGSETRLRSDKILRHIIKPAAESCGYEATRADEIAEPGMITAQIIHRILHDELVIADLTERNPNVFYELALRHAARKPFIQLIRTGDPIPFDVAGLRTIQVDHTDLDSAAAARDEMIRQMRVIQANPNAIVTPVSVAIDIFSLEQSGNAEDRSLAAIMASISDLKATVDHLTRAQTSYGVFSPVDISADAAALKPTVRAAIETLAPQDRTVLLLSLRGLAIGDIAKMLGLTFSATATRLARARVRLRNELSLDEDHSEHDETLGG